MRTDAFAQIERTLTGSGVPARVAAATVAEGADRLRVVVAILRAYGGPDALRVADAIRDLAVRGRRLVRAAGHQGRARPFA